MSKEELIQSFNNMIEDSVSVPIQIWISIVLGAIGLSFIIYLKVQMRKSKQGEELSAGGVLIGLVSAFLFVGGIFFASASDMSKPTKPTNQAYVKWRSEILYDTYIQGLPKEKIKVTKYELSAENGASVVLDTDHRLSTITGIRNIKYKDGIEPYVEARWTDTIEEVYQFEQYYNTTLYLPRENIND